MKNKKTNKGFTIIELLIIIGLAIILFSSVFAVQGRFLVDTYLDSNTKQIVQNLRLAQMRSITKFKDSEWGVYFDENVEGNDDKFVLFKGSTYETRDPSYDIVTNLPDSIALSGINLNGDTNFITFSKVTGETSNYGSIQIFDSQEGINTILINEKGLVGINETPGGSGGSGDTISPGTIKDLTAFDATEESITLSWTATGDDGNTGLANSYDLRYSTSTIDNKNWELATHVSAEPTPSEAGSTETMVVSGLKPITQYFFALKVSDEVPNESSLSNVPSLETKETTTTQSEYLEVDTSGAFLYGKSNNYLKGITIRNTGEKDIIIDKITVEWNNAPKNNSIRRIMIDSKTVWSGNDAWGKLLDIKDFTISSKQKSYSIDELRFSKNMKGSNITLTFVMADESTLTIPTIKL